MSGVEIVGVAASIIQVADLGTSLSVKLFSFYRRVKNANETIQLLSNEVALISAILRELGDSLKGQEASKLCSDEAFQTLKCVLQQCRDVLRQIEKVVCMNEQTGKSRLQQVTGKFKLVLREPSLNPLKADLERLKSTMLLLLNVIMFAGKVRNHDIPNDQEQRALIEALLQEKHLETNGINSPPPNYQQTQHMVDSKIPREPPKSVPVQTVQFAEVNEYNALIHKMLDEIDSCKSKLEKSRCSRIRKGVLSIHDSEIIRFQLTHGNSVLHHFDKSLLSDENDSTESPRVHTALPVPIPDAPLKLTGGPCSNIPRFDGLGLPKAEAAAPHQVYGKALGEDDLARLAGPPMLRSPVSISRQTAREAAEGYDTGELVNTSMGKPRKKKSKKRQSAYKDIPCMSTEASIVEKSPTGSIQDSSELQSSPRDEPELLEIERTQKEQYLSDKEKAYGETDYKPTVIAENKIGSPIVPDKSTTSTKTTSPDQRPVHRGYSRTQVTVQIDGQETEVVWTDPIRNATGTSSNNREDSRSESNCSTTLCTPAAYSPVSAAYSPTSPAYSPMSPAFPPTSPSYSPVSPFYSPASPSYSPVSHSNRELGRSPAFYSPHSRGPSEKESDDEAEKNSHNSPSAAGTLVALPESFEDLLLRWTKLGLNEVEAL
ncbi:hypothetical protein PENFLA_c018G01672 [Penicillium flavigenum]|uniref:Azaphilone pigments biosynthesis cluster protein L N-terminal domain-containing protein n=1 Tax=Penicillium flavigenum TaxID=254877 RepID=A0A1V6T001_9EURO|nr:hypothetical protein PENFLA_c018G01672 [Penicillium flavigenum]